MQFDVSILNNVPKNSYVFVNKEDGNDHIIEKTPTTGIKTFADKFTKDIFSYSQKGMTGSRNSNFYEFLSLGIIPNLIGSAMLILTSNALNNKYGGIDTHFASVNGRKMAAGVVLYAAGKWVGNKIVNKGIQAKTGIDLDMPYKKIIKELPEYKGDADTTAIEFHKVFESTDFPRWDLINKDGEEKGNRYEYYDKLTKKMGYSKQLNAPDQVVQPKIKEVLTKSTAGKAISTYIWAALGVAIASQNEFENFMRSNGTSKMTVGQFFKRLPKDTFNTAKNATKSLLKTKTGKGLAAAAILSSALVIWNSTKNFKAEKENKKSTVDYKKDYMEF